MSMNWTRQSRIRIATPRLDERDEASCAPGVDTAFGYVSVDMTGSPFVLLFEGKTPGGTEM
jgi:hypothetical protein